MHVVHVVERGEGTPIVLLHGFQVDHRLLLPLDDVIGAHGPWRRIHVDLPAHGRSPAAGARSAADVVTAVEAEIGRRVGDEPFALVGNSFGGLVARQIARDLRARVLGLALIAPVVHAASADRDVPPRTVLLEDAAVMASLGDVREDFAELAVLQTAGAAAAFVEAALPGLRSGDPDGQSLIAADYALPSPPEDGAAPFARPALVVTGRQDHVVGYRDQWALLDHYPRATFVALDGAGHNVHLDQPAATAALVTGWLDLVHSG